MAAPRMRAKDRTPPPERVMIRVAIPSDIGIFVRRGRHIEDGRGPRLRSYLRADRRDRRSVSTVSHPNSTATAGAYHVPRLEVKENSVTRCRLLRLK